MAAQSQPTVREAGRGITVKILAKCNNDMHSRRWAVGVLLYEMLAGYPPWQDGNTYAVYRAVLGGRLSFPAHFDPDAKVTPSRHVGMSCSNG